MATARTQTTWRVIDLINWGTEYFTEKEFEQPRREIERLLCDFLNCKRIELYLRFEEPLTRPMLDKFKQWVKRRVNHEPIQYISGKAGFYGIELQVNGDVLIPRPETERLVELALELIDPEKETRIIDIGTGSGCIAIALAKNAPLARIEAIDISEEALLLARSNAAANEVSNIQFEKNDILSIIPEGRYDLLVSNPPYVSQSEMVGLMPEVREYEPAWALSDGGDGLKFYRRFAEIAPQLVIPGGSLLLEVGREDHPGRVMELFSSGLFRATELVKDYNGDDRVLKTSLR